MQNNLHMLQICIYRSLKFYWRPALDVSDDIFMNIAHEFVQTAMTFISLNLKSKYVMY